MRLHGNGREHNPEKAKISCASTAFTIVHEDTMNEKSVLPTLLKLQKKSTILCSNLICSLWNFNKFCQLCLAKLAHLATLMKITYFVLTNTSHDIYNTEEHVLLLGESKDDFQQPCQGHPGFQWQNT